MGSEEKLRLTLSHQEKQDQRRSNYILNRAPLKSGALFI